MKINDKMKDNNISLLVFQGSWCPMCVSAMPQIAKFVSINDIDENRIKIINVNSSKSEPADLINEYSITRVPTIIFLENEKEFDRITEFAPNGWQKEIENKITQN